MALSEAQKKYLRGLGHQLKPLVMIGNAGLSDTLLAEYEATLAHHELIKVRVKVGDRNTREAIIDKLCTIGAAQLVQRIGNVAILYRENSEEPRIRLPHC